MPVRLLSLSNLRGSGARRGERLTSRDGPSSVTVGRSTVHSHAQVLELCERAELGGDRSCEAVCLEPPLSCRDENRVRDVTNR